jgi:hypothetical protein
MGPGHHKIGGVTNSERPYLAMVSFELLDILELDVRISYVSQGVLPYLSRTCLVAVPVLQESVLTNCPKVMTFLFKCNLHYTFVMRKYGFVTVAKIEAPDLDVLIGG